MSKLHLRFVLGFVAKRYVLQESIRAQFSKNMHSQAE